MRDGVSQELIDRYAVRVQKRLAPYRSDMGRAELEHLAVQEAKLKAREALGRAVKSGKSPSHRRCSRCGRPVKKALDMHGHHSDYSKPLAVEWMCRWCHYAEDRSGWVP